MYKYITFNINYSKGTKKLYYNFKVQIYICVIYVQKNQRLQKQSWKQ